jgi:hypothetical protein
MKLENKISLTVEGLDKCRVCVDTDCPLGQLYDFSCALQHFVVEKMRDLEVKKEDEKEA